MSIKFFSVFLLLVLTIYTSPSVAGDKLANAKKASALRDISKDSVFVGVVKDLKDAGDASRTFGVLGASDSTADVYDFFFVKAKSKVNSNIIGKKVKIFWSLQVDTTLDESNSFSQADSIQILNK